MASVGPRALSTGEVRWRVQHRVDGRMMQATFLEQAGAEKFKVLVERVGWAAAKSTVDARNSPTTSPTLAEWTAHYLDASSGLLTGIEEGTRADYVTAADRSFLKVLGDLPVDAITKPDVGRWVSWQERQLSQGRSTPIATKTVQNYHAILSAVLRSAVDQKLREDNPAWKTRITRGTKRPAVFLTVDEFATILHFTPPFWANLVMFLAGTGVRWGEATALSWGNVHLSGPSPYVRIERAWKRAPKGQTVLKQPKSQRSRRSVSMSEDVVRALGSARGVDDLVFPSRVGRKIDHSSFRHNVWMPMVARAQDVELCAQEGVTPVRVAPVIHDLRHSHASWLIAEGVPLTYVQARLGHESITTTVGTYGHLQPEAHTQMASIMGRVLSGVMPQK